MQVGLREDDVDRQPVGETRHWHVHLPEALGRSRGGGGRSSAGPDDNAVQSGDVTKQASSSNMDDRSACGARAMLVSMGTCSAKDASGGGPRPAL